MTTGRLRAVLAAAGVDAHGDDLADALWLASLSTKDGVRTPDPPVREDSPPAPAPPPPPLVVPPRRSDPPSPAPTTVPVHLPRHVGGGAVAGVPTSVAGVRALRDPSALARALRPVKRRVPSPRLRVVDDRATADLIADTGLWLPVVRPVRERWLDLALVVDDSASMVVWRQSVRELRGVLEQLGAFRDVRQWRVTTDGPPVLHGEARRSSARSVRELVDPTGRRVVLVVSDGLGAAWRDGGMTRLLTTWGKAGPVAVLQPLPLRLWRRTGLPVVPTSLRAPRPAAPNTDLARATGTGVAVPVLELEPEWLGPWAALVGGSTWTDLAVAVAPTPATAEPPDSPEALLESFRRAASAGAYRLACLLSAVPLSLPVMRLVQHAELPDSRPAQLAEVFLGGLLRRVTPTDARVDPDEIQYDFAPGVRDLLLDTVTRADALRLLTAVSRHLAAPNARPLDFRAVLADPDGAGTAELDRASRPFAEVARTVLARFPRPTRRITTRTVDAPIRRVHRPFLFVGLGGTGIRIGAEVERRLRDDLCGPDGTALVRTGLRPYQLPGFQQFVYVDVAEEGPRLLRGAVPDAAHRGVASRNRHHSEGLSRFSSFAKVATHLRANLDQEVLSWLPPRLNQPKVTPLGRGSGGLPTVARAVLFDALSRQPSPVLDPLTDAVHRIAESATDPNEDWEVYVAFSVSGGTGAGLFLDYLHLVDDAVRRVAPRRRIHPVVLLPSAVDHSDRQGGLNAGSALTDLIQLSDSGRGTVRHPGRDLNLTLDVVEPAMLFDGPDGSTQAATSIVTTVLQVDPRVVLVRATSLVTTPPGPGVPGHPEARALLREWRRARRTPKPADFLPWRRRFTEERHLFTRAEQVGLVHRFLCAAWKGQVTADDPHVPRVVTYSPPRLPTTMRLHLDGSWSGLVEAYEDWLVAGHTPNRFELGACLLETVVDGSVDPVPAPLFTAMLEPSDEPDEFRTDVLPAALALRFAGVTGTYDNLDELRNG
ncbi:SAV_2336 N-terminal domain-related protein [Actinosynnema sp. NPDC020468]|uniref:SAV_2336 N-terminal domain-related protein n=1 Tax=Actinosynnema sp. NPDC020468 TaxID=3154488 RepID=UPI0033F8B1D7